MTTNYTLTWSDSGAKPNITLLAGTLDDTTCSLNLTGKGYVNWGIQVQENLLHLLEHFANTTEPRAPTVGQLWYDTSLDVLKVYTNDLTWVAVCAQGGLIPPTPTPTPTPTGETPTPTPTPTPTGDLTPFLLDTIGDSGVTTGVTIHTAELSGYHNGNYTTLQEGDFMLMAIGGTWGTITPPAGWTESISVSNGNGRISFYYKFATALDVAGAVYSWSWSDFAYRSILHAFRNIDLVSPIHTYDSGGDYWATTLDAPSLTPVDNNEVLLCMYSGRMNDQSYTGCGITGQGITETSTTNMATGYMFMVTGYELLSNTSPTGVKTAVVSLPEGGIDSAVTVSILLRAASIIT